MIRKIMNKLIQTIKKHNMVPTKIVMSDYDIAELREELNIDYRIEITKLFGIELIVKPNHKITFYNGDKILE